MKPKIAIIGIGDELLAGFTVNGNGAFIARELFEAGFSVSEQRMVSDDPERLIAALQQVMSAHDLVICTGGLGPTLDDNTRATVESILKKPLKTLPNSVGTAPGLLFEGCILLPGVPLEMEVMMIEQVMPYLHQHFSSTDRQVESLHFFQVPEVEIDPLLRELKERYPEVSIGIYPRLGVVNVRLISSEDLTPVRSALMEAFGEHFFDADSLKAAVHEACVAKGLTLSTAESCTGGAVAAALTERAGASNYFLGSVVAYTNAIKEQVLGVSPKSLECYGAVSREVVEEMLAGLLMLTGSDLGVAISGIAGPGGGTPEKPIGLVWVAVGHLGETPVVSHFIGRGNRLAVIRRAVNWALAEIYKLF